MCKKKQIVQNANSTKLHLGKKSSKKKRQIIHVLLEKN